MRVKNQKDFWAGALCLAFGLFFAGIGRKYAFGTAEDMGPGYFPTSLGMILCVLGLFISVGGMSARAVNEKVARFEWKIMLLVLGPIVLFGLLLHTLGLAASIFMLVVISSFASHEFGWKAALVNSMVLIALCLAVFVWALKLQFDLWPTLFSG